jgi:hypothetical protein
MSEMSAYKTLVGKCKGKRQHGRPRRRCEFKMDVGGIGSEGVTDFNWLRIGTSGGLL